MLILMRANVPNGEIFAAKTDREMALVAVKYGVELPKHLSHLPTLPAPKTDEQKAEMAADMARQTAELEGEGVVKERPPHNLEHHGVKERPPRKGRIGLFDVTATGAYIGAPAALAAGFEAVRRSSSNLITAMAPAASKASSARPVGAAPFDDGYLHGRAMKEKAPSTRKKGSKGKKKGSPAVSPKSPELAKQVVA